jgi:hypothetical protein
LSDLFAWDIRRKIRQKSLTTYIHEERANSFLLKLLPEIMIFFPLRIEGSYEKYSLHQKFSDFRSSNVKIPAFVPRGGASRRQANIKSMTNDKVRIKSPSPPPLPNGERGRVRGAKSKEFSVFVLVILRVIRDLDFGLSMNVGL